MDFEKEHIIIFIVCLVIGFIIGVSVNTDNVWKGTCSKEQNELTVLTKEINTCLNQLDLNKVQTNRGVVEK